MADKKTRADLEIVFSSGKIPTQSNFADFIATGINQKDDGLQKAGDTPLKIQAPITVETDAKTPKDLILFYEKFEDDAAKWKMSSRSGGLEIGRGAQPDFIIDANGNVGIGTTDVKAKLHVVGGAIMPAEGNSESAGIMFPPDVFSGSGDRAYIRYYRRGESGEATTLEIANKNDADDHISLTAGGGVGIGTTTPGFPLTFSDALGDKISLWGQSGASYGFGIQSSLLQIHTDADSADIAFGSGSSSSFKETMRIKGNGKVGIGTNPMGALDVKGAANIWAGTAYAMRQGFMMPGSLTIGNIEANFGGGNSWNSNTAGLLLETLDNTEIAVHDAGTRVASLMYFEGGANKNSITIGRDMGWGSVGTLILNGKVGIGTVNPLGPLSVGDSSVDGSDGYLVIGKKKGGSTRHLRMGYDDAFNFVIGDYGYNNTAATWSSQFAIHWQAPAKSLYINPNGSIGIGTTNPSGSLNISEATGTAANGSQGTIIIDHENNGGASSIIFRSRYNRGSDFGYIQYQEASEIGGSGEASRFIIGVENDADDHLILKASGNVGINTMNPRVPLEVVGYKNIPLVNSPDGFGPNTGFTNWGDHGGNFNLSILTEQWIAGAGIVANSDRRIKEIIGLSDTAKDLEIIGKMRVTDYRPLDKRAEGNSLRRGFIAQEVLKVFPQAVGERTNVIPDIYSNAASFVFDEKEKTLSIIMPEAHTLAAGEVVQIITEDGSKTITVAAVPTSNSFVADKFEKEPQRVFVYGRQVEDFLTVNYDQIFSTGIGAIQELNKIVASMDAQIKKLRRRLSAQDKRLAKLEANEKTFNGSRAFGAIGL